VGTATNDLWNRCDDCGRFVAIGDFSKGAVRKLVYTDSELTRETYETLCVRCASALACRA
jgi:hypothetical protein